MIDFLPRSPSAPVSERSGAAHRGGESYGRLTEGARSEMRVACATAASNFVPEQVPAALIPLQVEGGGEGDELGAKTTAHYPRHV